MTPVKLSVPTAPLPKENAQNIDPKVKNGRRRRSSFAAIAARSGSRQSSFSVSLSQSTLRWFFGWYYFCNRIAAKLGTDPGLLQTFVARPARPGEDAAADGLGCAKGA